MRWTFFWYYLWIIYLILIAIETNQVGSYKSRYHIYIYLYLHIYIYVANPKIVPLTKIIQSQLLFSNPLIQVHLHLLLMLVPVLFHGWEKSQPKKNSGLTGHCLITTKHSSCFIRQNWLENLLWNEGKCHNLGGSFMSFKFYSYSGKWFNLTNVFEMGWNHQLVTMCTLEAGFNEVVFSMCCLVKWSSLTKFQVMRLKLHQMKQQKSLVTLVCSWGCKTTHLYEDYEIFNRNPYQSTRITRDVRSPVLDSPVLTIKW